MPVVIDDTVEIVGGLNLKDILDGGAAFDVIYKEQSASDAKAEKECDELLQQYIKLECVDSGKGYEGKEPFSAIAIEMEPLDGKIKKKILRDGYGLTPEVPSIVIIQYNAYVEYESQPFDSTYARKAPFSFTTGEGQVIEGLETSVLSMKINEKSQFLIPPELAYRDGCLGRIPPNAQVLFEIELSQVQKQTDETKEVNNKSFEVVYPACLALSIVGKKMVKLKDYTGAIKEYKKAIHKLEDALLENYDQQLKSEELLVRLYTNLLICYTSADMPKPGCVCAQKIYEMAKNDTFTVSAKVYFNHAKCQRALGNDNLARQQLLKARALEPDNLAIRQELESINEARERHKKQQQKLGKALVNS